MLKLKTHYLSLNIFPSSSASMAMQLFVFVFLDMSGVSSHPMNGYGKDKKLKQVVQGY